MPLRVRFSEGLGPTRVPWRSTRFRRKASQLVDELLVEQQINGTMLDRRRGRIGTQVVVALPVSRRSDGSWDKATAAVWAHVGEKTFGAVAAKRALVAADARVRGLGRKLDIAVLACWSELEHGVQVIPVAVLPILPQAAAEFRLT